MAKTVVIKGPDGDRVPFFRGILVQSLVNSGLAFDDAYALAQTIRDGLKDLPEISSVELRERVAEQLGQKLGSAARTAYENKPQTKPDIIVHKPDRSEIFSVGLLTRSLEACSLSPKIAMESARTVYGALEAGDHREISEDALRGIIYDCLAHEFSQDAAHRYLSWSRFAASGKPLILLLGGVSGSGKSTIAAELAYRLSIPGTQSTDFMREIIRSYLPAEVVPTLMYSSFEAWRGLPFPRDAQSAELENPVITGFLSQLNTLGPALRATVARSLKEERDVILEGVHVVPNHMDLKEAIEQAVTVPMMLATTKKESLRQHLKSRGREKAEERHRGTWITSMTSGSFRATS